VVDFEQFLAGVQLFGRSNRAERMQLAFRFTDGEATGRVSRAALHATVTMYNDAQIPLLLHCLFLINLIIIVAICNECVGLIIYIMVFEQWIHQTHH
jgi:hypothetical protein